MSMWMHHPRIEKVYKFFRRPNHRSVIIWITNRKFSLPLCVVFLIDFMCSTTNLFLLFQLFCDTKESPALYLSLLFLNTWFAVSRFTLLLTTFVCVSTMYFLFGSYKCTDLYLWLIEINVKRVRERIWEKKIVRIGDFRISSRFSVWQRWHPFVFCYSI